MILKIHDIDGNAIVIIDDGIGTLRSKTLQELALSANHIADCKGAGVNEENFDNLSIIAILLDYFSTCPAPLTGYVIDSDENDEIEAEIKVVYERA